MCPEKNGTDPHPSDRVFDFLEARLSPKEDAAVRAHLANCAECTTLYELAGKLHTDVCDQNARHLSADRLIALADRPQSSASHAEQSHLAICEICNAQLTHLRSLPLPPELRTEDRRAGSPRPGSGSQWFRLPVWGWSAAVLPAAWFALLFLVPRDDGELSFAAVPIVVPLEVQWSRGQGESGAFGEIYRRALQRYANEDYAGALEDLRTAAELEPAHADLFLFLGSAALLNDQTPEAVAALRRAEGNTTDAVLSEECRWQLANALLVAGDNAAAESMLVVITGLRLARFQDAQLLLERIARLSAD